MRGWRLLASLCDAFPSKGSLGGGSSCSAGSLGVARNFPVLYLEASNSDSQPG